MNKAIGKTDEVLDALVSENPSSLMLDTESIIMVIGVGGAGGNAVNHMYRMGITGVNFVVCNTDKSALKTAMVMDKDCQVAIYSSDGRAAVISTAQLLPKTTRNTIGVSAMSLKKKATVLYAVKLEDSGITNPSRYRSRNLPTAGAILKEEDSTEKQIAFDV